MSTTSTTEQSNITQPVGKQIQSAREKATLTLKQLSSILKITPERLGMIEQDQYEDHYVNVYFRGYIRNLCKYFQLDSEAIFAELNERGFNTSITPPDHQHTIQSFKEPFTLKPRTLLLMVLSLIILIISFVALTHTPTPAPEHQILTFNSNTSTETTPMASPSKTLKHDSSKAIQGPA
tara:strand:+ start:165 stop:701 length:537 start_codon:yes stop_codon:yes gene_type:complete